MKMGYKTSIQKARCLAGKVLVYRDSYTQLYEEAVRASSRKLFGLRASGLDRGFYCPSLIDDIVIGNVRRGSIAKNDPQPQDVSHVFYFASDNSLSAVDTIGTSKEVLLRENGSELGIVFRAEGIFQITQCLFHCGRIARYEKVRVFEENSDHITEYLSESYAYEGSRLSSCLTEHILSARPYLRAYQEYLYRFTHSQDSSESHYQIETHNQSGERVEGHFDQQQFRVRNNARIINL